MDMSVVGDITSNPQTTLIVAVFLIAVLFLVARELRGIFKFLGNKNIKFGSFSLSNSNTNDEAPEVSPEGNSDIVALLQSDSINSSLVAKVVGVVKQCVSYSLGFEDKRKEIFTKIKKRQIALFSEKLTIFKSNISTVYYDNCIKNESEHTESYEVMNDINNNIDSELERVNTLVIDDITGVLDSVGALYKKNDREIEEISQRIIQKANMEYLTHIRGIKAKYTSYLIQTYEKSSESLRSSISSAVVSCRAISIEGQAELHRAALLANSNICRAISISFNGTRVTDDFLNIETENVGGLI